MTISEDNLATRLLADLAVVTSSIPVAHIERQAPGFAAVKQSLGIYKNRHGRYAFAVPLLARFIRRQQSNG